uniref:Uncharacterized protein n=1 Tax=Anguilla anguilla TaxID=7936 RepID=A0A0E9VSF9_ANGAN
MLKRERAFLKLLSPNWKHRIIYNVASLRFSFIETKGPSPNHGKQPKIKGCPDTIGHIV